MKLKKYRRIENKEEEHNTWCCQEYSMKYIYSTSQMSKLSLILCTFSITGSVAGLFLTGALEGLQR